jgi:dihydrofolate reductase
MSAIVVQAFVTLDGVSQAPGGPDEDREGGFEHGGWMMDYDAKHDALHEAGSIIEEWEKRTEALLLGRKTYEIFAGSWGVWDENAEGFTGDLTRRYNRIPKYVASRTLKKLDWKNSQLLGPDVPKAVEKLRSEQRGEIRIWGSTQLIRTLAEHNLIDELRLLIYPIVLGTGKKLFADGYTPTNFKLDSSRALKSGTLVNIYRGAPVPR